MKTKTHDKSPSWIVRERVEAIIKDDDPDDILVPFWRWVLQRMGWFVDRTTRYPDSYRIVIPETGFEFAQMVADSTFPMWSDEDRRALRAIAEFVNYMETNDGVITPYPVMHAVEAFYGLVSQEARTMFRDYHDDPVDGHASLVSPIISIGCDAGTWVYHLCLVKLDELGAPDVPRTLERKEYDAPEEEFVEDLKDDVRWLDDERGSERWNQQVDALLEKIASYSRETWP